MARSRVLTSKDNSQTIPRLTYPKGSFVKVPPAPKPVVSRPQNAFYGSLGGGDGVNPSGRAQPTNMPTMTGGLAGGIKVAPQRTAPAAVSTYRPPGTKPYSAITSQADIAAVMPLLNAAQPMAGMVAPVPTPQQAAPKNYPPGSGLPAGIAAPEEYALSMGYMPPTFTPQSVASMGNKLDPKQFAAMYTFNPVSGVYELNQEYYSQLPPAQPLAPGNVLPSNAAAAGAANTPGAALAPGEVSRQDWGGTLIGGTPTTKDVGATPAGTAQYAQINPVSGNHWKVITTQDANGNWVRKTTYDYGRGSRARRKGLRGGAPSAQSSQETAAAGGSQISGIGLVTFNTPTG